MFHRVPSLDGSLSKDRMAVFQEMLRGPWKRTILQDFM